MNKKWKREIENFLSLSGKWSCIICGRGLTSASVFPEFKIQPLVNCLHINLISKKISIIFIDHILCPRHWTRCFVWVILLFSPQQPDDLDRVLYSAEENPEAQRGEVTCSEATDLGLHPSQLDISACVHCRCITLPPSCSICHCWESWKT